MSVVQALPLNPTPTLTLSLALSLTITLTLTLTVAVPLTLMLALSLTLALTLTLPLALIGTTPLSVLCLTLTFGHLLPQRGRLCKEVGSGTGALAGVVLG